MGTFLVFWEFSSDSLRSNALDRKTFVVKDLCSKCDLMLNEKKKIDS